MTLWSPRRGIFSSGSKVTGNYTADCLNLQVLKEKDTHIYGAIIWDAALPLLGPPADQAGLDLCQPANVFKKHRPQNQRTH